MNFLLLAAYTFIIGFITYKVYRKTGEFSFVLGAFLMYYWSLMGAWFILYDDVTADGGKEFGVHYYHLREILFPLKVDNNYTYTMTLYFLFVSLVLCAIWYFTSGKKDFQFQGQPVQISHPVLLLICIISVLVSGALVWDKILTAAKFTQSAYVVVRSNPGPLFTVHQLLNLCMVIALYIGFLSLLSGNRASLITGRSNRFTLIGYVLCIFLVEGYLLFLGNKKEIFFGGILGGLFYYRNVRGHVQWKSVLIIITIVLAPMLFNDGLRSYSPKFLTKYFDTSKFELHLEKPVEYTQYSFKSSSLAFLFSNEMFASHFSMYGVLDKKVPLTYGTSITSLGASVVPRFLWPSRPLTIYEYYAEKVNARPGQGYTIHHATGWYLNFGVAGVVFGALLFGWLWAMVFNRANHALAYKFTFVKLIYIIGVPVFAAFIPMIIRAGPEAYKTLVFDGILIPVFVIFAAAMVATFRKNKV